MKKKKLVTAIITSAVLIIAYLVFCMVLLPASQSESVSIIKWMVSNPTDIHGILNAGSEATVSEGTIILMKAIIWILEIAIVASLFWVGYLIQNDKEEANSAAVIKERQPYLIALDLYEKIKDPVAKISDESRIAMRNLTDRLKNESKFGYGDEQVIAYENEIHELLNDISSHLENIYDEEKAEAASVIILEDCKKAQSKLKLRAEVKKK